MLQLGEAGYSFQDWPAAQAQVITYRIAGLPDGWKAFVWLVRRDWWWIWSAPDGRSGAGSDGATTPEEALTALEGRLSADGVVQTGIAAVDENAQQPQRPLQVGDALAWEMPEDSAAICHRVVGLPRSLSGITWRSGAGWIAVWVGPDGAERVDEGVYPAPELAVRALGRRLFREGLLPP